jgi:hypothetical protein
MTYTPQSETVLTATEMHLIRRLLATLTADQLEDLANKIEATAANGNGDVIVRFYRGHPRFIGRLEWDDWR